jgi:hypothetical protein
MTDSRHRFTPRSWFYSLLLVVVGCGGQDVVTPNPPPIPVAEESETVEPETVGAAEAVVPTEPWEATISGFRFTVPAGWREVELNPDQQGFIDARFEIPAAGEDVSLTLSTVGGGIEANVQRWNGQFDLPEGVTPRTESLSVDGIDVTWVELQGTFRGMGGPFAGGSPPKPDWMMIGVAFEGEPQDFYIKLTGPVAAVEDLKSDFRDFVESARAGRNEAGFSVR